MKTAVQLRALAGDERPRAELLFGAPCDLGEGTLVPSRASVRRGGRVPDPEPAAPAPLRLPHTRRRRHLRGCRAGRPPARSAPHGAGHGGADPARKESVRVPRPRGPCPVRAARHLLRARRRGTRRAASRHKILVSLLSAYRPKPKRARARRGVSPRKAEAAKGKATPVDVVKGAAGGPRQARRRDA